MDTKVTLRFDEDVIRRAKEYAAGQNISLSRLVEILLLRTTMEQYGSLEDIPIATWVREISKGPIEYRPRKRSRKQTKDEFFSSRK
jgi:antitoxin component of RelBE/YafQ-DinJ toxin-antitoxin module